MWFYAIDEQQHGPESSAGLRSLLAQQSITPQTLVWRDGMPAWLPMEKTELAAELTLPLPEGDTWETCAYSDDQVRRSEMIQLEGCWVALEHKDEAVEYIHEGGRLPKIGLEKALTGCLELGHLIRSSWRMVTACLKPACGLYLLVWIPGNLLCSYVDWRTPGTATDASYFFSNLMQILLGSVSTGGILFLFSQHLHGMRRGLAEAWAAGFANWSRLMTARLVAGLLSLAGLLFFVVPCLIVLVRTFLAEAAAVDGQTSGTLAVQESWEITRGRFWLTFGYAVLVSLMCALPLVTFEALMDAAPALRQWVANGLISTVLELPLIYLLAFTFCYYKELQAAGKPRVVE